MLIAYQKRMELDSITPSSSWPITTTILYYVDTSRITIIILLFLIRIIALRKHGAQAASISFPVWPEVHQVFQPYTASRLNALEADSPASAHDLPLAGVADDALKLTSLDYRDLEPFHCSFSQMPEKCNLFQ
jgi:hypothetical protein